MMRVLRELLSATAVAALLLSSHAALAESPASAATTAAPSLSDLAARFGAREFIRDIALSPNGQYVAIVENMADGSEVLATANLDVAGPTRQIMQSQGGSIQLQGCFWATDARLVCRMDYISDDGVHVLRFTRMISLNADGSDTKLLTVGTNHRSFYALFDGGRVIDRAGGDKPGSLLMTRTFVPELTTGTRIASDAQGLGVEQVDVVSLRRQIVEAPLPENAAFITDGMGQVRLRADVPKISGYDKTFIDWSYRKAGSREWLPLGQVRYGTGLHTGFEPLRVDPKLDAAYGLEVKDGMRGLYTVKLDGSMTKELVLSRSDVDIDGVVTIGRHRRVVGATYATDRRQVEFFDAELKRLGAALNRALPGHPQVDFVDSSADESKLLLFATSDTNPGMFYRFDKGTHHLEQILPARPQLAQMPLAEMKPVSFTARDGSQVPAYLTLPLGSDGKNLPAIVMPHGGPGARDEWGFDWLAQFFAARGFAVLQPNFHGSSGYGANWFEKNGFQSWRSAIGDIDDAGKWLISAQIADPAKLAIVGWGYGGYAALQSGVFEPGLYKAIVAIAPVTDLRRLVESSRDFTDYEIVSQMIGDGPYVKEGSPAQNAQMIQVPVLMFQGTWDMNVPIDQSRTMLARLKSAGKRAELVEFPKLDHQLDDAKARTVMLTRIDGFLRQTMGM